MQPHSITGYENISGRPLKDYPMKKIKALEFLKAKVIEPRARALPRLHIGYTA